MMKKFLIVLAVLFVFYLIGKGVNTEKKTKLYIQTPVVQNEAGQSGKLSAPVIETKKEKTELSGVGQKATANFFLERGLVRFNMTHNGTSNFSVKLLDANTGDYVELLVNEIGTFNGSKAVQITKTGDYLLDISADGNWSITIE